MGVIWYVKFEKNGNSSSDFIRVSSVFNGGQNTACRDVTDYFLRHFYSRGKLTSVRHHGGWPTESAPWFRKASTASSHIQGSGTGDIFFGGGDFILIRRGDRRFNRFWRRFSILNWILNLYILNLKTSKQSYFLLPLITSFSFTTYIFFISKLHQKITIFIFTK